MMTGGNVVYVASQNAIWRLVPIPLKVQIDQLVENKEFEEALHLLQAIEDNQYNDRVFNLIYFHLISPRIIINNK